ncbi:MAG: glycosyltransferase [Thaumarchaeota archaeon]|nr:glycosyltransferase [Nitrososphaerota archaeon]
MLSDLVLAYNFLLLVANAYTTFPLFWSAYTPKKPEPEPKLTRYPKISLLLPAYQEGENLRRCIKGIEDMDYPADKIELIIITEINDFSTTRLAKNIAQEPHIGLSVKHVIVKETGEPRGKPRALNQALEHATGEIVGVLDAEDIADPKLFAKVAYQITEKGFDAVQGILDMANDYDGWMNLHFRAEYGHWYNEHLPSLYNTHYPLPFGGTTNFFKKQSLERLGAWDSYNLTEDFELGLRFYAADLKVGIVKSVTREESPLQFNAWLRQRTRWQRGKLQTLRKIIQGRPRGPSKSIHILLTCIVPHVPLLNLMGIAVSVYSLFTNIALPLGYWAMIFPNFFMVLGQCLLHANGYLVATKEEDIPRKGFKVFICAATLPAYWICFWTAELRALKQEIIDKKIFWEKTEHQFRHAGAFSIYRRSGLISLLKKGGYSLREKCKVTGASGMKHEMDIYGKRGDISLMVRSVESKEEVSYEEVLKLSEVAWDIKANQVILTAIPKLSKKAKQHAEYLGINVIESENMSYNINIAMPTLNDLQARK